MPNARVLAAAALAVAGCATSPVPGQPLGMRSPSELTDPVPSFTRQGEIVYSAAGSSGSSAAWDARSVRGPAVNLTLTDAGLWGGTIQERAVLLRARDGRITGEGVDLFVNAEGDTVHLQGLWFGRMVRIDVSPRTLSASPFAGVCAMELSPGDDGFWRGFGGCGGRLDMVWMKLRGVAADPSAEMPQWFFAFLAALPSVNSSTIANRGGVAPGPYPPSGYFLAAEYRGPPQWLIPPPWQFTCYPLGTGGYPACSTVLGWRGTVDQRPYGTAGVDFGERTGGSAGAVARAGAGGRASGIRTAGQAGERTAGAGASGGGRRGGSRPATPAADGSSRAVASGGSGARSSGGAGGSGARTASP